ncbi:hypothetical protein B7463_g4504, partial [Scytalidium lignicola]
MLPVKPGHDEFIPQSQRLNHSKSKWAGVLLFATITGLILWLFWQASYVQPDPTWANCGHSATEARTNGCIYEPMLRSWIPPECYFKEPSDEYDPFSDRAWFLDKDLTRPATPEDLEKLRRGDDLKGYTRYFHDEHCLYALRKLAIAMDKKVPLLDTKTASIMHSTHCTTSIAEKLVVAEASNLTFPFPGFPNHSSSPIMFQGCVPTGFNS